MTTRATGTFRTERRDERPVDEGDGRPKLARASAANVYHGDVEGTGTVEYLMLYRADDVPYVGLERIVGRLGGRQGSFVLRHDGVYADGAARAAWSVVPGSGTGELRGLRGEGGYVGRHEPPETPFTLDYEIG